MTQPISAVDGRTLRDNDFIWFLVSAGGLILYLIFSAMTEMGTKLPWRK